MKTVLLAGLLLVVGVFTAPIILYDMHHHKAMIVKDDGCYEYHMNHQDVLDSMDPAMKPALELFLVVGVSTAAVTPTILYDMHHHKAMIVMTDGCYEYHMNHQDVLDSMNPAMKPVLEARMLQELAQTTEKHSTGHNHIKHMTAEIRTACASLPVYGFEQHAVATTAQLTPTMPTTTTTVMWTTADTSTKFRKLDTGKDNTDSGEATDNSEATDAGDEVIKTL